MYVRYGDEYFAVYAGSLEQARQYALGWGGEAIRELNENEYYEIVPIIHLLPRGN